MNLDDLSMDDRAILQAVAGEVQRARLLHSGFPSGHYYYSVIKEELDELWDAIKENNLEKARYEARHVAATAIRFMSEVPGGG